MNQENELILLLKENEPMAKLIENMLERQGFHVVFAASVSQAQEILHELNCLLILIDMPLQSLLVRQCVRQFCEQANRPGNVLLLVEGRIDLSLDGLDILVDEIIRKPVRDELLIAAVKRHVRNTRLERKLEYYHRLAIYDDLTNIYNRRFFGEVLEREFSRSQRNGKALSLLMVDVDDFKSINDTYGHRVGDQCLAKVSRELELSLRSMDIICRYGGEEFVIILPETGKEKAMAVAERLRRIIAGTTIIPVTQLSACLTVSMGVVSYPYDAKDKDVFISCADTALYFAKHAGKNRVCGWNPNDQAHPIVYSS